MGKAHTLQSVLNADRCGSFETLAGFAGLVRMI